MAGPRRVPERFKVPCSMCGDELDMRAPGVHTLTKGWVKNRAEGGGNAVVFPERLGVYACQFCIDRLRHGSTLQAALF